MLRLKILTDSVSRISRRLSASAEHQQRRLVDVRDQEQQEILVAELPEQAAVAVDEERLARVADHCERVAAGHRPRSGAALAALVPVLVVAVTRLEVLDVARRVRQRARRAGRRHQPEPHEVAARQRPRIVHRQVREQRHPAVLDLPVADLPFLGRIVGHERMQKKAPVRRITRRAVLADEREVAVALLVIGLGERLAGRRQPFDTLQAMAAGAVVVPVRRVRAAEPVHRVLRELQRHVVAKDLDDEEYDIEIVEKAQVGVRDAERDRSLRDTGKRHPHGGDVAAAEYADRRFGRAAAAALRITVEEPAHVRQEGDELAVVPLLEPGGTAAELVAHLAPRIVVTGAREHLPVLLDLRALADRRELQRPQHDLPEVPDELRRLRRAHAGAAGLRGGRRFRVLEGHRHFPGGPRRDPHSGLIVHARTPLGYPAAAFRES
jgi:hypothetical protein